MHKIRNLDRTVASETGGLTSLGVKSLFLNHMAPTLELDDVKDIIVSLQDRVDNDPAAWATAGFENSNRCPSAVGMVARPAWHRGSSSTSPRANGPNVCPPSSL